jgi:S-adenosylmethionine hydrolase
MLHRPRLSPWLSLLSATALLGVLLASPPRPTAAQPVPRNGIVAILTDFGDGDYLAGALRGAVLSANPASRLVTVGNEVPSFDVREGAYWLQQAARHYPPGTVFLAIIDPDIAAPGARKLVVETAGGNVFVGPDNGLLSLALADTTVQHVYQLTSPALMAPGALADAPSFGRDVFRIFAHAAGALAGGAPAAQAGPELNAWTRLTIQPPALEGAVLHGEVLHVDTFGNVTTNVGPDLVQRAGLALGPPLTVTSGAPSVRATFARAFADVPVGAFLVYLDGGALKIAINTGSAAAALGARAGQRVAVAPADR